MRPSETARAGSFFHSFSFSHGSSEASVCFSDGSCHWARLSSAWTTRSGFRPSKLGLSAALKAEKGKLSSLSLFVVFLSLFSRCSRSHPVQLLTAALIELGPCRGGHLYDRCRSVMRLAAAAARASPVSRSPPLIGWRAGDGGALAAVKGSRRFVVIGAARSGSTHGDAPWRCPHVALPCGGGRRPADGR